MSRRTRPRSSRSRRAGLPLLAFTCGDPAGIGAEAAVLALERGARAFCAPLLVGEAAAWRRAGWTPDLAPLQETGLGSDLPSLGCPSALGGRLSFAALRLALRLAARNLVSGLVTAPISKKSWDLAGIPYRDHTEWLRREVPCEDVQMVLSAPSQGLWCVLATRHLPLAQVPGALSVESVLRAARSLDRALRRLGRPRPRLGLCGLNPHAGEQGLLGEEERRVLLPASGRARREGLGLEGPIAADAAWRRHRLGEFDGLVCLYHDQALIPLKMAGGLEVVNWTAGLPFVRTSPGHGTGFDIAGRKEPDCAGTLAAARLAARLAAPENA